MAWSPVRRFNAGRFEVEHPGDYATLISNQLRDGTADLTTLQKNNNGVFPFERTYSVIDGREMLTGHGTRDMPVWGSVYNEEASDWVGLFASRSDATSFVRGRILALIGYISTLQEK